MKIHEIKKTENYKFHENDLKFESYKVIGIMSLTCMIAAMICACTGISGGMVLGPLFLKYNMHPQIMSGTNQYIAMIAILAILL